MPEIRCENCKHYVATHSGVGLCCYSRLFAAHVRSSDYCECYEAEHRKEQDNG